MFIAAARQGHGRRWRWVTAALVAGLWACGAMPAAAVELERFESEHYRVHTTLERERAQRYAEHMDRVLESLKEHFAELEPAVEGPLDLYLLSSRGEFLRFLEARGVEAGHSDGMFVHQADHQGLVTWAGGRSRSRTLAVLQHEGFHQFAWHAIGPTLPVWLNEGLAQYFEDAVLIDGQLEAGLVDAQRIEHARRAVRQRQALSWELLHSLSYAQWDQIIRSNAETAAVLYAQSWSVVYYLMYEAEAADREAFGRFLERLSAGEPAERAFERAFAERDTGELEQAWIDFTLVHEADALSVAVARLRFMAHALEYLEGLGEPMPGHIVQLRSTLREQGYAVEHGLRGMQTVWDARDHEHFMYEDARGEQHRLRVERSEQADLPPRVTAPRLSPQPTLQWSRRNDGRLIAEIVLE